MRTVILAALVLAVLCGSARAQTACPAPSPPNNTVLSIGINSTTLAAQGIPAAVSCIGITDANAAALIATYAQSCPPTVAGTPAVSTPCTPQQVVAYIAQSIVTGVLGNVASYVRAQAAAAAAAASATPTVTPLAPQ